MLYSGTTHTHTHTHITEETEDIFTLEDGRGGVPDRYVKFHYRPMKYLL